MSGEAIRLNKAAYDLGRLINEIRHKTTVLYMMGTEQEADSQAGLGSCRVDEIPWKEALWAARKALPTEVCIEVETLLHDAEEAFKSFFRSDGHIQFLENECRYPRERELEQCQEINENVQKTLKARDRLFYLMGRHIDQLRHPSPAFELRVIPKQLSRAAKKLMADGVPERIAIKPEMMFSDPKRKEKSSKERRKQSELRIPGQPSSEWWSDLREYASVLQLAMSEIEQSWCCEQHTTIELAHQIEECVFLEVRTLEEEDWIPTASKLKFNKSTKTVRNESDKSAKLKPGQFKFLLFLALENDDVKWPTLANKWDDFTRRGEPSRNAVSKMVCEVNSKIRPLKAKINLTGRGDESKWRLSRTK